MWLFVATRRACSAKVSTNTSFIRKGVGQVRVVAGGDVGSVVSCTARACGGQQAAPRRFSLLGGKHLVRPFTGKMRERLRPVCREFLETLAPLRFELNPSANHDGMLAEVGKHEGAFGALVNSAFFDSRLKSTSGTLPKPFASPSHARRSSPD